MKLLQKVLNFKRSNGSFVYLLKRRSFPNKFPRQLLNKTEKRYWSHSARRINEIMDNQDFKYLEIGVAEGTTLQAITSTYKVGVDPNPLFNITKLPDNVKFYSLESDIFFKSLSASEKFDVIFLDGLHEASQLLRDLINSLKSLNNQGYILIDDIVPSDSISAIPDIFESYKARGVLPKEGFPWHGDCFKILPIVLQMDFLEKYLIIFPNNPQLLLRVSDWNQCRESLEKNFATWFQEIQHHTFNSVFAGTSLKNMPIFLEEFAIEAIKSK
jgi:hypothetical protein